MATDRSEDRTDEIPVEDIENQNDGSGTMEEGDEEDTGDGTTTVISSLSSNTGPSTVVPLITSREESVQSPPPVQRTTNLNAATTPAFGIKACYSRNEDAAEAGAAAAAQDAPEPEATKAAMISTSHQQRSSPRRPQQEEDQVPPLAPLARMPSTGKSVTPNANNNNSNNLGLVNDDGSSFATPPPPPRPQRMSRQSTPGAISVPGIAATTENEEQHDNLLSSDDDVESLSPPPSSSTPPPEQRPTTLSNFNHSTADIPPDSPPIVAELASSTFSYDADDLEDRIAERLEAQMNARLQQEVDRRLSQERRQHAIAEVLESPDTQKPNKPSQLNSSTISGDSDHHPTSTLVAMHVREEENFKICGIRRTCWGMILCTLLLFIIGGVVGTILWFGRDDNVTIATPTMAPSTLLPTSASPSTSPSIPLEDRRWDHLLQEIGPSIVPQEEDPVEYFDDPSTPQYEALEWMAATDLETDVFETPQVILVERYAIATIYFITGGATNWTEPLNFLSSSSVCDWNQDGKGVFCSNSGPLVTSIVIPTNGLQGIVPWELSLLEYLLQVQLDDNFLTGTIPTEIGTLTMLQSLWIQSNDLTGALPSELASATSLESIDLAFNSLRSPLPSKWASLPNLFFIRLRENGIAGTLPGEWQGLTSLKVLDLEENFLDGNLPREYGTLTQLTSLYLESNNFQGSIPSEYGDLTDLRNFFIYGNSLSGQIPTQYSNLSKLNNFWFHDNDLTGDVNDIFCLFPQIENLRADCLSDGPGLMPQVNCSCCSSCCRSNGTNCVNT